MNGRAQCLNALVVRSAYDSFHLFLRDVVGVVSVVLDTYCFRLRVAKETYRLIVGYSQQSGLQRGFLPVIPVYIRDCRLILSVVEA